MTIQIPLKKVIALLIAVAILWIAYYSNYLPLQKSKAYITALRGIGGGQYRSVDEFQRGFSTALDLPSPIGHEELVRNMGSTVVNIMNQNRGNPQLINAMSNYVETYFEPIITSGRGMSYNQNLFLLANMNQLAYVYTRDTKYLERSLGYYERGVEIAPRRPQFLYGLFDTYRLARNTSGAIEVGEKVLAIWPDDQRMIQALTELRQGILPPLPPLPGEQPGAGGGSE
jgi:hypothetical protein